MPPLPPLPHPGAVITSPRNPRVLAATALRGRHVRDETGLTLLDGTRELARALAGGARVLDVFVDGARLDVEAAAAVSRARATGAAIIPVSALVLDRIAYGDRSGGVVATVAVPDLSLAGLNLPANPLVVVLEGVEKPGNLGAVLRSADGAGADAVIAADPRTDLFNPNAVRASLGTIFAVPVAAGSSAEVRAHLAGAGVRIVVARVDGSVQYTDVDLRGPVAIVLGSEADGVSDAWSGPDVAPVVLPMLGVADSLNVSVAAAVLLYEARRQRGAA
jgi:TrmH family RNA methyltransferase